MPVAEVRFRWPDEGDESTICWMTSNEDKKYLTPKMREAIYEIMEAASNG
jgi:hypothetical protein